MPKKRRRGNGEGTIYQRANGTWAADVSLEDGKRKTLYAKTRREVQEKLKKVLHDLQQGKVIDTPRQTLEQFLVDWLKNTQEQSVRPRTFERYEELMRIHVIPTLGHHQLQKLAPRHIQALYASKLKEGLSPTTVNHIHNVLHKALETAKRWQLVGDNICELVSPPRANHFEFQPLSVEQVQKLLETAKGRPFEALLTLALATGMRRGELLGLKWQDIDFNTNTLQVRRIMMRVPTKLRGELQRAYIEAETKTKSSRRNIVIAPFALQVLKKHRIHQKEIKLKAGSAWQEQDLVFCTSIGTPINPTRDVLDQLKKLLKEADLPDIRFHDLRHCAATLLLTMDVHPKVVQEILGHSNISITMDIYSHVLPGMQEAAMDKLNTAFQKNEEDMEEDLELLADLDEEEDDLL